MWWFKKSLVIIFIVLYSIIISNVLVCGPVAGSTVDDSPHYYESIGKPFCWFMIGPWYFAFFLLVVPTAFIIQYILFPSFGDYLSNVHYTKIGTVNILTSIIYPLITLLFFIVLVRLIKFMLITIYRLICKLVKNTKWCLSVQSSRQTCSVKNNPFTTTKNNHHLIGLNWGIISIWP